MESGRVGCHTSGDGDWGIVNEAPKPDWMSFLPDWTWTFSYPHNVINEGIPIPGCEGSHCSMLDPGVFPTPFYESLMCLGLFLVLWTIRKKMGYPGVLFCVYLIFNGIERFSIEKIRVNAVYQMFGTEITQAEIISVCLVIVGIVGILIFRKMGKKELIENSTGTAAL